MRAPGKSVLLAMLVLSFTVSTLAQESLYKELTNKGFMLYLQGRYAEATNVAEEALRVAENTFGPDHPGVAEILKILAMLYHDQGNHVEAEPLYKRSLAIREKVLGPDHPDVATICENLGKCYKKLGKEDEAEKLEARARKIRSGR